MHVHTHTHTGRERPSTYTVRLTRGKRAGIPQSWKVSLVSAGGVGQSLQACLDLSKACSSYTQVLCTRHMMNHTDRHPHHQWYLLVFVQEMAYDNEHVQKTLSSLPVHTHILASTFWDKHDRMMELAILRIMTLHLMEVKRNVQIR